MTKEKAKNILAGLFVPRGKDKDGEQLDGVCFKSSAMDKDNADEYAIYNAVSDAMQESGLTHSFSYEIASAAVSVLVEAEDWSQDGQDDINELIDSSVPVYTNHLTEIYRFDSWAVDDARQEFGVTEDSASDAARAWYQQIYTMTGVIQANLEKLIDPK